MYVNMLYVNMHMCTDYIHTCIHTPCIQITNTHVNMHHALCIHPHVYRLYTHMYTYTMCTDYIHTCVHTSWVQITFVHTPFVMIIHTHTSIHTSQQKLNCNMYLLEGGGRGIHPHGNIHQVWKNSDKHFWLSLK